MKSLRWAPIVGGLLTGAFVGFNVAGDLPFWLQSFERTDPLAATGQVPSDTAQVVGENQSQEVLDWAEPGTIDPAVISVATDYARSYNSSSLIILRSGRIETEQYFGGMDRSSTFDARSMTSVLLGLLVGVAIDDGAIGSIDDPVNKYIDEWRTDARGGVTIRQLLQMNAGFGTHFPGGGFLPWIDRNRIRFGDNVDGRSLALELEEEPGNKWEYNLDALNLLGIVVERASNRPFNDYLSEKIWQKLKLPGASMVRDRPDGAVLKACCLMSRPIDWAIVGDVILNKGALSSEQLVAETWVEAMATPSHAATFFGYQIWIGSSHLTMSDQESGTRSPLFPRAMAPFRDPDMLTIIGEDHQRVWISPAYDLVIVRTGNHTGSDWDETKIPNLIIGGIMEIARRELPKTISEFRQASLEIVKPEFSLPGHSLTELSPLDSFID